MPIGRTGAIQPEESVDTSPRHRRPRYRDRRCFRHGDELLGSAQDHGQKQPNSLLRGKAYLFHAAEFFAPEIIPNECPEAAADEGLAAYLTRVRARHSPNSPTELAP